jgi:hypothetical protein
MVDEEGSRDVPGFPGYAASDAGRIMNVKRNVVLTGTLTKEGYSAALGLLRCGRLKGEQNPNVKLNEEMVREVRGLRRGGATLAALGKRYGVS